MIQPALEKRKVNWHVRFMHALKNFRSSKKISQAELAKLVGVTSGLIGQYESPNFTANSKLVNCLSFLEKFSSLLGSSITDFVAYLDEGVELQSKAPWEESILEVLSNIKLSSRRDLHEMVSEIIKKEDWKRFESYITLLNLVDKLNYNQLNALIQFINALDNVEKQ